MAGDLVTGLFDMFVGFIGDHPIFAPRKSPGNTITGCVQVVGGAGKVIDLQDYRKYTLVGYKPVASVHPGGEQLTLLGSKVWGGPGGWTFHVKQIVQDTGACANQGAGEEHAPSIDKPPETDSPAASERATTADK